MSHYSTLGASDDDFQLGLVNFPEQGEHQPTGTGQCRSSLFSDASPSGTFPMFSAAYDELPLTFAENRRASELNTTPYPYSQYDEPNLAQGFKSLQVSEFQPQPQTRPWSQSGSLQLGDTALSFSLSVFSPQKGFRPLDSYRNPHMIPRLSIS